MCSERKCKEVEAMEGWATWGAQLESIPPDYLAKMRTAFMAMCKMTTGLDETRAAFVELGEMIRHDPNATRAMRDLGEILERVSMARAVLERMQ